MKNSLTANVEFDVEAGILNGSSMSLTIFSRDEKIVLENFTNDSIVTVPITIDFPQKVLLHISGKGSNDTVVDSSGNIIADKYIKIVDIRVDNMSVDPDYLPRFIELVTNNGDIIYTNYFGFNGSVTIDFSPTPFQWLASTKRV